jgi:hypothetical protein
MVFLRSTGAVMPRSEDEGRVHALGAQSRTGGGPGDGTVLPVTLQGVGEGDTATLARQSDSASGGVWEPATDSRRTREAILAAMRRAGRTRLYETGGMRRTHL